MNSLVDEVIELTRPRWRDLSQRQGISINIERNLASSLPLLLGDPSEIREAFTNLIFNAVDALPSGGAITFTTRVVAGPVSRKTGQPSTQIQVEVRDNGIGMDEKTRQRCLEPFFSTKAKHGGTGLGLAMVYGMIQRHEGAIGINSTPGKGTSFELTFPVREQIVPAVAPAPPRVNEPRSLHVLCIDDESVIREILNDSLTNFNHRVTVASSGKDGIELFRTAMRQKQPYQAVITDLGMPEMDGHQVARIIKAESPKTPIIMLTGWGAIMKEEGETAPEVDAIIAKPARIDELNNLLLETTDRIALSV